MPDIVNQSQNLNQCQSECERQDQYEFEYKCEHKEHKKHECKHEQTILNQKFYEDSRDEFQIQVLCKNCREILKVDFDSRKK